MAPSVLFYSSHSSSSCPSSGTASAATPVARAGCSTGTGTGSSCVAAYAAPSWVLLVEHSRIAVEVLHEDGGSPKAAAKPLDLGALLCLDDQKVVFWELIKISRLIQETSLEIKSLYVQVQEHPYLDATSIASRHISVYQALKSLTDISGIDIAPHPDNLFVVLCMLKSLTELFSLSMQKFLPLMQKMQYTEHVASDVSTRFGPTLLALRSTVRRTFEVLEVWIMQAHAAQDAPHGGGIHEITRYLMMYIAFLLEHGAFSLAIALDASRRDAAGPEAFPGMTAQIKGVHTLNGIVGVLMHHLETTLEKLSSHYQPAALQCLFLGNNMHFMVQHKEVLEILGGEWVLRRRDKLGICISRYLDVSWAPVLSCLRVKGVMDMIPACFRQTALRRFTLEFEEACRTQKEWKVDDPLLRKYIRQAAIRKVIPAYRSYLEKQQKNALKLMKYKPEDLMEQLSDHSP